MAQGRVPSPIPLSRSIMLLWLLLCVGKVTIEFNEINRLIWVRHTTLCFCGTCASPAFFAFSVTTASYSIHEPRLRTDRTGRIDDHAKLVKDVENREIIKKRMSS